MIFFILLILSMGLFFFSPWWSIVIVGFLGGLVLKNFKDLWQTIFTSVFLSASASLLVQIFRFDDFRIERISGLLSLPHPYIVIVLSALVFAVLSFVSAWFVFELKRIVYPSGKALDSKGTS